MVKMGINDGQSGIQLTKGGEASLFTITIRGRLAREDYEEFVPQLEWQIAKAGRVNLLIELVAFRGWTVPGLWEDIRFAAKHYRDIGKIAVVGGGNPWERGLTTLCKPLTGAQVRFFRSHQKPAALRWAGEGS
jgi:hypothetical protein